MAPSCCHSNKEMGAEGGEPGGESEAGGTTCSLESYLPRPEPVALTTAVRLRGKLSGAL